MLMKIGELAKRTGLSVRTLHHYDKIGLLSPSQRSSAAYRLYNRADITRLYRIVALRRLDLSLAEIAALVDHEHADLNSVISDQLRLLEQQINNGIALRERLRDLHTLVQANKEPQLDYWLGILEMMSVADKYFSPDDMQQLSKQNRPTLTPDLHMLPLIVEARSLLDTGVAYTDPRARELALRWNDTMNRHMPDLPQYLAKFSQMHRDEPALQALTGIDPEMMDFIVRALIEVRYAAYRQHLSEHELRFFRAASFRHAHAWNELFSQVRKVMQAGMLPEEEAAQVLLRQWRSLFFDTWGGDLTTIRKVRELHRSADGALVGGASSPELMQYARRGLIWLEARINTKPLTDPMTN
ncbi:MULTISPECIES: MerR family transcriptional regulator [unclassified Undibacterium]|uniref:MerR family transcriptional regulator n=1 Tax=unclassified Undibacterium TaxID=2630295 RepID=UPI002AC89E02|nr:MULTISPECIES: MerR family transcriptional regulator [unclassified Undibacterium]MEB0138694.1 MerR family transcriptional regulator [Undibacterium sp. CCC2.1]MEB0171495.1 MerR family transcriptional regulator [Undibacterium sp. CCC1.1]MEB0175434.1 MerR family transcriptional regulator [Undibacterium sp. CCC3.4]MEB0214695.1 MerR family transcriptional regulator [Undibacterium sp. 5I2]WPX43345.1 MerR family transcriptional regulator [Undibacterium sp. CCC3.4]